MRRIPKPWPPADVSPEGQQQRRLVDAEREYLKALPNQAERTAFARSEFDRLNKAKLREVMYQEQRSICVFCERRVEESYPEPRIDHWKPLSGDHPLALHWKNLYLSCPAVETCDEAKGDNSLRCEENDSDLPWPADFAYEDILGFTSGGKIYVRTNVNIDDSVRRALALAIDAQPQANGFQPSILNLNHKVLVAARIAAIDGQRELIAKEFVGQHATTADREQRATALLQMNPFLPFVSVRVAWLRKTLGRGQD
jgi:uncharacterized protein (TIGR02646 family)